MTNENQEKNQEKLNKENYPNKENHLEMFRQLYYESQNKYNSNFQKNLREHYLKNNFFNSHTTLPRILI